LSNPLLPLLLSFRVLKRLLCAMLMRVCCTGNVAGLLLSALLNEVSDGSGSWLGDVEMIGQQHCHSQAAGVACGLQMASQ